MPSFRLSKHKASCPGKGERETWERLPSINILLGPDWEGGVGGGLMVGSDYKQLTSLLSSAARNSEPYSQPGGH